MTAYILRMYEPGTADIGIQGGEMNIYAKANHERTWMARYVTHNRSIHIRGTAALFRRLQDNGCQIISEMP